MKKQSCIALFLMIFSAGCAVNPAADNAARQTGEQEVRTNPLLSDDESECFNGIACSYMETYTNGLGQECKIFADGSGSSNVFCSDSSSGWYRIQVL